MPSEPCKAVPASGLLHLTLPGDIGAVSAGVRRIMAAPFWRPLDPDFAAAAELVLAEVLNNVVEHAYRDHAGEIEVSLEREGGAVSVRVADRGRAMPEDRLPAGCPPEPASLPEGGFGWHLIRTLTRDLSYRRFDGWNIFHFRMDESTAAKQ